MRRNKIEKQNFSDLRSPHQMDRRDFLKNLGGGIVITFSISGNSILDGEYLSGFAEEDFNSYLLIREDGRTNCYTGKIEMGQGPITSLPQMLADELDVSLDSVDIIMGDTDICPYDQGTYGSLSTRDFGQRLRAAGAEARGVLLQLAAENLDIPIERLTVENGIVSDINDKSKQVTYAQLTRGKKIVKSLSEKPPLKKPSEFKVMGKSLHHVDAADKVTGKAKYSADIQLPGMLYARILRPPTLTAKLTSLDLSGAETIKGIEIVQEDDLIAVLHEIPDMAGIALAKIKAEYETDETGINDENIFEHLVKNGANIREVDQKGSLSEGKELAAHIFEEEYMDGYVAHAPIEPHTATAVMEGDIMTIWASCQTPYPTREEISEELGLPLKNVRLMQIFVGGGFGGKTSNPQAVEAARLAKITGKPVQLVYTREEEFFYDRLRPAAVVKITSGISGSGQITLWDYAVYFAGSRGAAQFYSIPHHKTVSIDGGRGNRVHPFYTGAWRAPAQNTNTFAREQQIDMMAAKAGIDPLEFRLKNLEYERMITVLKTAAKNFGYTPQKGPSGRGYGMACGSDTDTCVAVFVEIEVDKSTGHVQVKRASCAQDMGLVVNPQGAIIQAEGCIIMGLGYALSEDIKFENGEMLTKNFDTYEFTRFSWTPEIDVELVESKETVPHGGGEPAIICMGGAVGNAIFDATGARLYQMPMTPERVLEAIRQTKNG